MFQRCMQMLRINYCPCLISPHTRPFPFVSGFLEPFAEWVFFPLADVLVKFSNGLQALTHLYSKPNFMLLTNFLLLSSSSALTNRIV